ncbi:hypothetical protein [Paraburkholderia phenazinium]|uniref:Bbp19-like phage domain-containing protein n=1 Tax=Paraburkholderia phenazinium TaxID=60549 RepID=A0A1N6KPE3_9BURK|nr:hypothetical protein [Paraburkholderia phenazinium]SIO58390.1 hypothetical protein SAMN05444165_4127 [Paraburkholderia phenazinium]
MRSSTDTEETRYDAGDATSVKEKAKQVKIREERRLNGLRQTMSTADGRLWMWELLSTCRPFHVPFSGNASKDAFENGMHNIGLMLFAQLRASCKKEYDLMEQENA